MIIEYLCRIGHVQYRSEQGPQIVRAEYTRKDGVTEPESDLADHPQLVQGLATATRAVLRSRDNTPHNKIIIDSEKGSFLVDDRAITPDDDATAETAEVKAALDAFYGPNRDSDYAEIYRLLNLQDEPDTVVTQKVSKPVIKNVNGQLRRVIEEVDEPVMEEVPVYDESGVEVIDTIQRQKIRKGRKVSDADRSRLNELLQRVRNV